MADQSAQRSVVIDADPMIVYKVITDFERYPEFITSVNKVNILEKKGEEYLVEFEVKVIKTISYTLRLIGKPGKELKWTLSEGFFTKNNGSWILKKLKDGKTEATYSVDLGLGLFVPKTIVNALVSSSFPKMLSEVKSRAEALTEIA